MIQHALRNTHNTHSCVHAFVIMFTTTPVPTHSLAQMNSSPVKTVVTSISMPITIFLPMKGKINIVTKMPGTSEAEVQSNLL